MKTKTSRKIFPHEAPALVFDWSPDGKHLACVLGIRLEARVRTAMACGSVSPTRSPPRGGTCRARTSWRRPSWDRCSSSSAPRARPGRPMASRLPSSPLGKERLRATPVNRGSGSVGSPGGVSKKSRENRPGSVICTGRLAAKCSVWCAAGSNRRPVAVGDAGIDARPDRDAPHLEPRRRAFGPAQSAGRCAGLPAGARPEITWPTWSRTTFSGRRARSGRSCWSPTPWLATPS